MNHEYLYYLTSRILSLELFPGRSSGIIKRFPSTKNQWQRWVQTASNHMVLPACFLALKRHQLLTFLPDELQESLKYIYELNYERNLKIEKHARYINKVLKSNNITPLFMKGSANLLDEVYHDIGERMMYDIDILVKDQNMLAAVELLTTLGYKPQKPFIPSSYPSTMHYPIMYREGYTAGIEIHRIPVQYLYLKKFSSDKLWESARESKNPLFDGKVMPDDKKMIHNFIHSQLMHSRHYYGNVSLRDLYDILLLSRREDPVRVFSEYDHFQKQSQTYLQLYHRVFEIKMPEKLQRFSDSRFFFMRHKISLRASKKKLAAFYFLIMFSQKYILLPVRTLWNREARNYVFSRLTQPAWYGRHMAAYKRMFTRR
ncbi:MAG: nucleotidyltransferase family protein [Bacteroidota bacterium]